MRKDARDARDAVSLFEKSDPKTSWQKGIGWADGLLRKNPIVL